MTSRVRVTEIDGDTLTCLWHAFDFTVKTGECSVTPELRVATFAVKTEANDLLNEVG